MDPSAKRKADNETLFREVNERVEEVAAGFGSPREEDGPIGFVCECGHEDCAERVELTQTHYESVRSNPTRFFVVPGHEQLEVERVVERQERFLVVEKIGEGAEIAAEHDPRS